MNAIRCRSKFEKETQLNLSSKDMNKERNFVLDIVTFIFHIIYYHRESTSNYSHKITKVPLPIHILNSLIYDLKKLEIPRYGLP